MRDQREVFPGLDSGPNGSEGHYFYALEKRPSGPSLYTTYGNPNNHYLFIPHGTFSTKILAFFTPFFIATNIANKPLSDCITSPKTILPFHFSPKPTAEGETKRQQTKQLQFHKINTKKRTYVALVLSDVNRTFLPTSLNSSPGANCQICLLFTERYQSQKPESV